MGWIADEQRLTYTYNVTVIDWTPWVAKRGKTANIDLGFWYKLFFNCWSSIYGSVSSMRLTMLLKTVSLALLVRKMVKIIFKTYKYVFLSHASWNYEILNLRIHGRIFVSPSYERYHSYHIQNPIFYITLFATFTHLFHLFINCFRSPEKRQTNSKRGPLRLRLSAFFVQSSFIILNCIS